jgi:uncharacterized caspase-like protein
MIIWAMRVEWLLESGAKSVTVFLDACFSGGTRGDEVLMADRRGFGLSARDESVPTTFTLISAATGDQTSTSLPEAGQGLFSYFLMKGWKAARMAMATTKLRRVNSTNMWPRTWPAKRQGWPPIKRRRLPEIQTGSWWPGECAAVGRLSIY